MCSLIRLTDNVPFVSCKRATNSSQQVRRVIFLRDCSKKPLSFYRGFTYRFIKTWRITAVYHSLLTVHRLRAGKIHQWINVQREEAMRVRGMYPHPQIIGRIF